MTVTSSFVVLLLTSSGILVSIAAATSGEINIKIERHFPCTSATGPSKENLRIKFPSYKTPGVKFVGENENSGHNKCFRMSGGQVQVFEPGLSGSEKYYVHLETRIGIHGKPERCVNADENGCGGIGSCVHCDICKEMGTSLKDFVQLYQNDKPAKCDVDGVKPGKYNNISLRVCLPTKKELLPFLDKNADRAEQLWDLFVSSRAHAGEIPLVIAARIFNRPINKLSKSELQDAIRGSKRGMIGCHWIYATVSQK